MFLGAATVRFLAPPKKRFMRSRRSVPAGSSVTRLRSSCPLCLACPRWSSGVHDAPNLDRHTG